MNIPQHHGLSAVIERYDALIVDLWGVVHNGVEPYAGVLDCLDALGGAGKRICLLTNAPRRPTGIESRLLAMGIGPSRYQHVMTSGEATYEALRDRDLAWIARLGRRFVFIGPDYDQDVFDGLDYVRVDAPAEADFVLNCGPLDLTSQLSDYETLLEACLGVSLPMICANPDMVAIFGDTMKICAGTIAAAYADLGGDVLYFGKPHPTVYDRCFALLGVRDRSRILAVGDGLRTDIAGANAVGIDSAFIVGGIHAEELGVASWGEPADPAALAKLVDVVGPKPSFAIPRFVY